MSNSVAVLIPAYNPDEKFIRVIDELYRRHQGLILIVNDGSTKEKEHLFEFVAKNFQNVVILKHATNLGKGNALKTGMNHILVNNPEVSAIVTADADGQHVIDDVLKVVKATHDDSDALILGTREFSKNVPFRSRFGNRMTRVLCQLFAGIRVGDTQTGLRGFSTQFALSLLKLRSYGYEFELDMLMQAKQEGMRLLEVPIQTVYIDGNRSSHFNPLIDSMKIYFILLRFVMTSMATGIIDYFVFLIVFTQTQDIVVSSIACRAVASGFNFLTVKRFVFHSTNKVLPEFLKYATLVCVMGFFSIILVKTFSANLGIPVVLAKLISELMLYFVHFTIQRDIIFIKRKDIKNEA